MKKLKLTFRSSQKQWHLATTTWSVIPEPMNCVVHFYSTGETDFGCEFVDEQYWRCGPQKYHWSITSDISMTFVCSFAAEIRFTVKSWNSNLCNWAQESQTDQAAVSYGNTLKPVWNYLNRLWSKRFFQLYETEPNPSLITMPAQATTI